MVILSPLFALVSLMIAREDGLPVFFRQRRVGQAGRIFSLVKFRSMRVHNAGPLITSAGDPRFTRLGRLLRRTKIDELPQLWNVLKGDMSLVGPRPEVPVFVDCSRPCWNTILSVKPGITDPASLAYRDEEKILGNSTEPEEHYRIAVLPAKLAISLAYMKRRSFWLDLKVILLTLLQGLFPSRVQPSGVLHSIFGRTFQTRH